MSTKHSLPHADKSVIEAAKLTGYLLSAFHPKGREKANFFKGFGFSIDEAEKLEAALREHGKTRPVVYTEPSVHGLKYILECSINSPDKRNPCIRTVWIVDAGEVLPRLVTAYPIGKLSGSYVKKMGLDIPDS